MKTKIFRSATLFALLFGLFIPATQAQAAQPKNSQAAGVSPASLLNPDGTINLNRGFNGALDLSGWQVTLDPQRGPVLAAQNSGTWQSLNNGTNGSVYAVAISNGLVYIGGSFSEICGNAACNSGGFTTHNMAIWNGAAWQKWGGYGVDGGLYTIVVSGSNIYIAGLFGKICADQNCITGTSIRNIARWDGSTWYGLGYGLDGFVYTVAVSGNTLYAGGYFSYACGNSACNSGNLTVNHIAKWDGITWSAVGYGMSDSVYALAISGSDVYVGGNFAQLCGNAACNGGNLPVNYVARWSAATSTWYGLGNGLNGIVRSVAVSGSNVYWGGYFTHACGNSTCNSGNIVVNYIARWNGSTWFALGNGLNYIVNSFLVSGSNVYVGGGFYQICGNASCDSGNTLAIHIATWNGSSWSTLGNGVNGYVYSIVTNGSAIYAGGSFVYVCGNATCDSGNVVANNMAKLSLPITKTIASTGSQDGWVLESSETSGIGSTLNDTAITFVLGDNGARKQYRGVLSFSTGASLPDNATITRVILKIKQQGIVGGGNPVTIFQGFMADIKNGFFGTAATLQITDFQAAGSGVYGPFSPAPVGGFYSINLTGGATNINKLAANSGLTQIRLRFKLDDNNNAIVNYLSLYSGNAVAAADRPQLVITYTVP